MIGMSEVEIGKYQQKNIFLISNGTSQNILEITPFLKLLSFFSSS